MSLRPAAPADASSLAALSIEVWLGTYLRRGVNGFFADYALAEFTTAKMAALIADPRQTMLVSDNVEGIDGFVRVTAGAPAPVAGCSDWEIATLYVQPRHHGRGRGRALLEAACTRCRDQGAASVWLATNSENTPARAFYRARGFGEVGQTQFRIADQTYENTVYRYVFGPDGG